LCFGLESRGTPLPLGFWRVQDCMDGLGWFSVGSFLRLSRVFGCCLVARVRLVTVLVTRNGVVCQPWMLAPIVRLRVTERFYCVCVTDRVQGVWDVSACPISLSRPMCSEPDFLWCLHFDETVVDRVRYWIYLTVSDLYAAAIRDLDLAIKFTCTVGRIESQRS